ncbi:PD40 domain-containing protein, partial [Candidatus Desantisbacteria bacterium]|nr:PD40 domain-containing protein [Candidatus Desantisbacteria bacterium]
PPIKGETLFIATGHGEIIAINISDGSIIWRNKIAERIQKKPLQFENMIFLASDQGYICGLDIFSGSIFFKHIIDYYPDYSLYYDYSTEIFYYFSQNKKISAFKKINNEKEYESIEDAISNRDYFPPPVFSPDGKFCLYSETKSFENDNNLYRIEFLDSLQKVAKLTLSKYDDIAPQWLYDSNAILFSSNRSGFYNIYKMDTRELDINYYDDLNCTRSSTDTLENVLTVKPEDFEKKYLKMLTDDSGDKKNPVSSYDGEKILYTAYTGGNQDLWIMDSTGQNQIRLTARTGNKEYTSFSPDGKNIVYVTSISRDKYIYTINYDGFNELKIAVGQSPRWLNDSTIVYEKTDSENKYSNLWLIDKEGIRDRQLTSGNYKDCFPCPSPDGKTIAFLSNRKNKKDNIWLINSSGKRMVQITNFLDEVHPVSWSQDGNKLIFFIKNIDNGEKSIKFIKDINKESIQEFFTQAEELIYSENFEEALDVYKSIITDYPDQKIMVFVEPSYFNLLSHSAAFFKMLLIAEYHSDFEQIKKISQIIADDNNNDYDDKKMFSIALKIRIKLLDQEFEKKEYNKAIEGYKKILRNFPEMKNEFGYQLTPYVNTRMAECYEKLNQYDTAISIYKKMQAENPSANIMLDRDYIGTMALCFLNLARIYEIQYHDYNNALLSYFEIFKIYPDDNFFTFGGEIRGDYSQKAITKIREIFTLRKKEIDINNWLDICLDFSKTLKEGKLKNSFKSIIKDFMESKNKKNIKQPVDQLNRILFTSRKQGKIEENNYEIYSMNDDGTDLKRVTFNKENDYHPVWSRSGSKIAYHTLLAGNYEVLVMDTDGTNQLNLTNSMRAYDFEPSWSFDDSRLSFTSDRDGNMEIYIMNQDGTEQKNITNSTSRDFESNWSPVEDKIVFTSDIDGNLEIYLIDPVSNEKINLSKNSADDNDPAFSPEGDKILFISNHDGNEEIYMMNIDGSEQKNLSNHPSYEYNAVWSSDGKYIIFVSNRDTTPKIFIMNYDGTNQIKLTDNPNTYDIQPNELLMIR